MFMKITLQSAYSKYTLTASLPVQLQATYTTFSSLRTFIQRTNVGLLKLNMYSLLEEQKFIKYKLLL